MTHKDIAIDKLNEQSEARRNLWQKKFTWNYLNKKQPFTTTLQDALVEAKRYNDALSQLDNQLSKMI